MASSTQILKLQYSLYRQFLKSVDNYLEDLSVELKQYYREYQKGFRQNAQESSRLELVKAVLSSQVVFCGDYHTLDQAQRTVSRILRAISPVLKQSDRELILLLEMIPSRKNRQVKAFLAGEIDEATFLKAIGFFRNWGFPWANYGKLIAFAKKNGVRVVGIDGPRRGASLAERDKFFSKILARVVSHNPKALAFVLVGDMHLAKGHLPKQFKKLLPKAESMVIHQNNESLYWRFARRGKSAEVLRFGPKEFCIMNTPPWIKVQSLLKWSEIMSLGGKPLRKWYKGRRRGEDDFYVDPFSAMDFGDEFGELVQLICSAVGLKFPKDRDFEICCPAELKFLTSLSTEGPGELGLLAQALMEFDGYYIPHGNRVFLKDFSLNQAGHQAGRFIHHIQSGNGGSFRKLEDFYSFLWSHALGYVGSKFINPKRKCDGPLDLSAKLSKNQMGVHLTLALDHLTRESVFQRKGIDWKTSLLTKGAVDWEYLMTASILGKILGEAIYMGLERNSLSLSEIKSLFSAPLADANVAHRYYLDWGQRLDREGLRMFSKGEKL